MARARSRHRRFPASSCSTAANAFTNRESASRASSKWWSASSSSPTRSRSTSPSWRWSRAAPAWSACTSGMRRQPLQRARSARPVLRGRAAFAPAPQRRDVDGVGLERPLVALGGPRRLPLALEDLADPAARDRQLGRRERRRGGGRGWPRAPAAPPSASPRGPRMPASPFSAGSEVGSISRASPVGGERAGRRRRRARAPARGGRGGAGSSRGSPSAMRAMASVEQPGHAGEVAAGLQRLGEGERRPARWSGTRAQRLLVERSRSPRGSARSSSRIRAASTSAAAARAASSTLPGLGDEHLREAGPVARPHADVGQGADGGEVPRLVHEHLLVVGPGLGRVARVLGAHPGQPEVQPGGLARLDPDREGLPEGCLGVGRAVELPVEKLAELEEGPGPDVRRGRDGGPDAQEVGEPLDVAALAVAVLERAGDLDVSGCEPVGGLQEAERLRRLTPPRRRPRRPRPAGARARPREGVVAGREAGEAARERLAGHAAPPRRRPPRRPHRRRAPPPPGGAGAARRSPVAASAACSRTGIISRGAAVRRSEPFQRGQRPLARTAPPGRPSARHSRPRRGARHGSRAPRPAPRAGRRDSWPRPGVGRRAR